VIKLYCLYGMLLCYSGRYYYWNTETDEVSWLSPDHPRAVVTLPADRLKGFLSLVIYVSKCSELQYLNK